jgi:hypothetical protein
MTNDDDYGNIDDYQQLGTDQIFTDHRIKFDRALRWTGHDMLLERNLMEGSAVHVPDFDHDNIRSETNDRAA